MFRASSPGLTIVETLITLLALGVVLWLALDPVSGLIRDDKRAAARAAVNAARDAALGGALARQALPEALSPRADPWNTLLQYAYYGSGDVCSGVALGSAALWTLEYADGTRVPNVAFLVWSNGENRVQDLSIDASGRLVRVATGKDDIFAFVTFPALYKLVCQPTAARGVGPLVAAGR
jgi:type II secretory pathway pseudopilin PulG